MNLWIGKDTYLGSFNETEKVRTSLNDWQRQHEGDIFYLFEFDGKQYSFPDSWEEFLEKNIDAEHDINIITASREQILLELGHSTGEYLEKIINSISGLAATFYKNPDRNAWNMLSDFIEGVEFISKSLILMNLYPFKTDSFNAMLSELLQAIEVRDSITIADLLTYEWHKWLLSIQIEFTQH